MMRDRLVSALACVLVASTGAYAYTVSAPITFAGPGNSLTATGSLSGTVEVSGAGGYYTYDTEMHTWVSQGFTIASQQIALGLNPDALAISATPTGSMLLNVDSELGSLSLTSVNVNLLGSAKPALALDQIVVTADLDGGGTTALTLDGMGSLASAAWSFAGNAAGTGGPNVWSLLPPSALTAGINSAMTATYGSIVLGQFNAAASGTGSSLVDTTITLSNSGGPWYVKNADVLASFDQALVSLTGGGTLTRNTYSGSQYPYYAVTLNYSIAGDLVLDGDAVLHGTVSIPEPTTLALLILGPAAMGLRKRS
jgi:hypothetical protein